MSKMKNRRVYKRDNANSLRFLGVIQGYDAADCAKRATTIPGKFVVMDLNFTEVTQVYVTLHAEMPSA